jgi:DNA-binding response OmpR family regulator
VKQTILLVEDDRNLADGLLVSLEEAGTSGQENVRAAE